MAIQFLGSSTASESMTSVSFLRQYVARQIDNLFPSLSEPLELETAWVEEALNRVNYCVRRIKAFGGKDFDPLNSGQYATFLYYLSSVVHERGGGGDIPTKLFLLNKALNGIELFYEVKMPPVFLIGHTVGTVFAKATYGSHCIFHQGCTVGRNGDDRPVLERGVILYPNASVIGACRIGENTVVSPGVQLVNTSTPGHCIVFSGPDGRPVFKPTHQYYAERYLDCDD